MMFIGNEQLDEMNICQDVMVTFYRCHFVGQSPNNYDTK